MWFRTKESPASSSNNNDNDNSWRADDATNTTNTFRNSTYSNFVYPPPPDADMAMDNRSSSILGLVSPSYGASDPGMNVPRE